MSKRENMTYCYTEWVCDACEQPCYPPWNCRLCVNNEDYCENCIKDQLCPHHRGGENMKFGHAHCLICGKDYFKEEEVIAFSIGFRGENYRERFLERVSLEGKQPWSGVRAVCKKCANFLLNEL